MRDVITQQDLLGNIESVNKLLNNDSLLSNISLKDIRELYQRLTLLIYERDKSLPQFTQENITEFWQNLLKSKIQKHSIFQNKQRICLTEGNEFIAALEKDTSEDVKLAWVRLFNGNDPLPYKKTLGELQR